MSEFCEKLEEKLKEVMTSERGSFRFMEPMKRHTTFRIGGPAAVFISPGSILIFALGLNLTRAERGPEPVKRRKYPLDHPGKWKQPVSQ